MKRNYSKPRTETLNVSITSIMVSSTGGYDPVPEMGETSASSGTPTMGMDSKRFWNL